MGYAFESLMINEFNGRDFTCSVNVPAGPDYTAVGGNNKICATVGAAAGSDLVSGTEYLRLTYNYDRNNLWR